MLVRTVVVLLSTMIGAIAFVGGYGNMSNALAQQKSQKSKKENAELAKQPVVEVFGALYNLSYYLDEAEARRLAGQTIEISAMVRSAAPEKFGVQVYDGVVDTLSELHNGDGRWQRLTAALTISNQPQFVKMRFVRSGLPDAQQVVQVTDLRATVGKRTFNLKIDVLKKSIESGEMASPWVWDGGIAEVKLARAER